MRTSLLLLATLWLTFAPTAIAEESAPSIDQLLAQHLDALGGVEKLDQVKTVKLTGRYIFNGIENEMTIYRQRPNRYRFELVLDSGQVLIEAYDGQQAWSQGFSRRDPSPRRLEGDDAGRLIEESAYFDSPLRQAQNAGTEIALIGEAKVEGVPMYQLRLKFDSGRTHDVYLNQDTMTIERRETSQVHPRSGEYQRVFYYLDFASFEGWNLPVYVEREDRQHVRAFEFEKVELNVELDDALFSLPNKGEPSK